MVAPAGSSRWRCAVARVSRAAAGRGGIRHPWQGAIGSHDGDRRLVVGRVLLHGARSPCADAQPDGRRCDPCVRGAIGDDPLRPDSAVAGAADQGIRQGVQLPLSLCGGHYCRQHCQHGTRGASRWLPEDLCAADRQLGRRRCRRNTDRHGDGAGCLTGHSSLSSSPSWPEDLAKAPSRSRWGTR